MDKPMTLRDWAVYYKDEWMLKMIDEFLPKYREMMKQAESLGAIGDG